MRFAYADPPYLGCGALYAAHHPKAMAWDDPQTHRQLVERLMDEYADGWAVSLHEPSLRFYLSIVPEAARVASWVKPFAIYKPNVTRAWTWEPVIFHGGRPIPRSAPTWRDHVQAVAEPITLRRGLTGAKPDAVCDWILTGLGFQPGDEIDDLFPGTGAMGRAVARRNGDFDQMNTDLFKHVSESGQ
jgi:hypothetical protein